MSLERKGLNSIRVTGHSRAVPKESQKSFAGTWIQKGLLFRRKRQHSWSLQVAKNEVDLQEAPCQVLPPTILGQYLCNTTTATLLNFRENQANGREKLQCGWHFFPPSIRVEFKIETVLLCSVKITLHTCLKSWPRFVPNMECVSIAYKTKQNRMHTCTYHRIDVSDSL